MAKPFKQPAYGVPQGRDNKPIILGAVALVVVLGLVAVLAVSLGGGNGSSEPDANVAQWRTANVSGSPLPPAGDGEATDPAVGVTAPTVTGATFDGTPYQIDKDGKGQVIVFYAHWCPHCQAELPGISQWLQTNASRFPNVDFHAVATGTAAARPNFPPSQWFKEEKYPLPVIADDHSTAIAQAFGLNSYPYFVVLDKNHNVITRTSGEIGIGQFESLVNQAADS